jgi:hypothetical protein
MSSITLGDLTPNDIGKQVTIESAHTSISGALRDLRVETAWVIESKIGQHPDEWEQVPGRRTVSVAVGEWSATLPLGARVEVER